MLGLYLMKAIAIERYGGPDVVRVMEMPNPTPMPGELLIGVAYASINPVDWKIREGWLRDLFPSEFPIILGWDAAGTVVGVGEGVAQFKPGDRVFAYCRKDRIHDGTYAEFTTVSESAAAPVPRGLDLASAAAIPLTSLTAWQALHDIARIEPKQTVLIHGGAGGVGGMAVQIAKYAGAKVYTTARTPNHGYVKELGADLAIDYTKERFSESIRRHERQGVDIVLDTIGGDVQRESYSVLKRGGRLVALVEPPDLEEAARHEVRAEFMFVRPDGEQLRRIGHLLELGRLRAPQIEIVRLDDAAEAMSRSQSGHVRGKIVLRIA